MASLPVGRLSAVEIDRWHARLRRQGLGEGMLRNDHLVVRAVLSLAVRWGWLPANPASAVPLARRRRVPRGA